MRTKDEILKESKDRSGGLPQYDITASLHERLQIEVLIDIRDILYDRLNYIYRLFYEHFNKT